RKHTDTRIKHSHRHTRLRNTHTHTHTHGSETHTHTGLKHTHTGLKHTHTPILPYYTHTPLSIAPGLKLLKEQEISHHSFQTLICSDLERQECTNVRMSLTLTHPPQHT